MDNGKQAAVTADLVHLMRDASGLGMMRCKEAADMAATRLDGDFALALLIVDAHSLAVNVRSRDPAVADAEARWRWDLAHARARRAHIASHSPAWARLVSLSGDFAG